jgi:hypothetical protein
MMCAAQHTSVGKKFSKPRSPSPHSRNRDRSSATAFTSLPFGASPTTYAWTSTRGRWSQLNKAARCVAVRHFWRALKGLTDNATVSVVVDPGTTQKMTWTAERTAALDQREVKAP